MNRPIALCYGVGFSLVFDAVKLLCCTASVVLRSDSYNGLVAGIRFHNILKSVIELCEDRGSMRECVINAVANKCQYAAHNRRQLVGQAIYLYCYLLQLKPCYNQQEGTVRRL